MADETNETNERGALIDGRVYSAISSWADWGQVKPDELINRALRQWLAGQERMLGNDAAAEEWLDEGESKQAGCEQETEHGADE